MSNADGARVSLEVRLLVAFLAVARTRSFGAAAQELGYTQSAVSQQIAALERSVGQRLFERPGGPRPVELTAAGQVLVGHAEAILGRVAEAEADLAAVGSGTVGRLSVGVFQSVSVRILPEVLRRFREESPKVEVRSFESDDQTVLLDGLASGDLDVTFLVGPLEDSPHEMVDLGRDDFVVISSTTSPLVNDDRQVPVDALSRRPIIAQSGNSPCQILIERGLQDAGAELDVVFRTGDNAAVQAMVRSGLGEAVMPMLALDRSDPHVVISELDPPIPARAIQLAIPRRHSGSAAVRTFAEIARKVCAEVLVAH